MTTMLIIDDEYYIRLGIRQTIDWESIGVTIVGEAENGEDGLEKALALKPDLILMDIRMPFLDGIQLMEKLTEHQSESGIIVLSGYDEFEYAQKAIRNQVLDYLLKPIKKDKLLEVISRASKTIRQKKDSTRCQKILSEEMLVLRMNYLRELFLGKLLSPQEIQKSTSSLDISTEESVQSIAVKLDHYNLLERQLSSQKMQELRKTIERLLSEHFSHCKSFSSLLTDIAPDEWGILLVSRSGFSENNHESELRQSVQKLMDALNTIAPQTVSVSVSKRCPSITEIHSVFQTARIGNNKLISTANSVVYPDAKPMEGIRPEVQKAIHYIKQHFNQDITVQAVAKKLYVSPSYLMHIFKNDLNKTFNTFLTEYRLEAAKELLQNQENPIYKIAKQVGYQDVKYFNKIFKRYTQMSPSEYVRLYYAEYQNDIRNTSTQI